MDRQTGGQGQEGQLRWAQQSTYSAPGSSGSEPQEAQHRLYSLAPGSESGARGLALPLGAAGPGKLSLTEGLPGYKVRRRLLGPTTRAWQARTWEKTAEPGRGTIGRCGATSGPRFQGQEFSPGPEEAGGKGEAGGLGPSLQPSPLLQQTAPSAFLPGLQTQQAHPAVSELSRPN